MQGGPGYGLSPGPVIPPPPAAARRQRSPDHRWLVWGCAFAVGVGIGVASYRWMLGVDTLFDYWLALVTG